MRGVFDLSVKETELIEKEKEIADPSFWNDQESAKRIISRANRLKEWVIPYSELRERISDVRFFLEEAVSDSDILEDLWQELSKCSQLLEGLESKRILSSPGDDRNCFFAINAGAGGTESCDWTEMLFRMYSRWFLKHDWTMEILDKLDGDVAGIKNVLVKVSGEFVYGYCRAEKGVHRLVRISPFDSNARRHTSFASVDVFPELDDDIVIDVKPGDLRIDTYRSSGAGGQHVNVTDSAVRITHLPTGIVVTCQNERSQIQNRESCMKILKARLYEKEVRERKEQLDTERGEKREIAWGSQIRNYVFQPYTLVKDARTGFEIGDVKGMMDGEFLDDFVIAYLKKFGEKE
ncbi:MAG: peptide chain release factor 2 [Victivallaceae bacterium]